MDEWLQNYLILLLMIRVISYLVPFKKQEETIRRWLTLGVILLILMPALRWLHAPRVDGIRTELERLEQRMDDAKWEEGVTIYELFPVGENAAVDETMEAH